MCGINFIQSSFEIKKINFFKELDRCNFYLKKNKIDKILPIIRLFKRNQIYIELIKRNSRRYAKKQITWFRRDETVNWFEPTESDQIIAFLESKIK